MRPLIFSLIFFSLIAGLIVSAVPVWAQITPTPCDLKDSNGVCLLQPDIIGGQPGSNQKETSLGHYLSLLFKTLIGLAGGISVLIIVVSGLQYIISEVPGVKTESKGRITNALVGLVLALSAWLILYTINPDLVNLNLKLEQIKQTP